ncbi:hypothetical protein CAEBREN_25328 [Caenorhabditis brenneri]|uniref:Methyltransferase type 11 domain-containing protein n=1 Tax=Caenorhabditis brenneri TaxID=135651 RepID=G0N8D3_CAEBE|nr:hypothetical protein CAEBREN_25328 [Caenorhabditis brenneri]
MPRLYSTREKYLLIIVTVFYLVALWFVFESLPENEGFFDFEERLRNSKIKRRNIYQEDVTLEELEDNLYSKNGYEVVQVTTPVPTLRFIQEPTCDKKYRNNAKKQKPAKWDIISELMTWKSEILGALSYSFDGVSLHHAMKEHELNDKSGLIVGSLIPWVEVLSLKHGASNILTIEYNKLNIEERFQDRMSSISPMEFSNNWEKYMNTFDFAASFSSIEHIGLGQYGEPLDPIGDLREIQKIRCVLKPGGILFLGLPFGLDAVVFNLHRIYGPIRLAMLMTGFEWIATYSSETNAAIELNKVLREDGTDSKNQYTLVLKKI